MKKKAILLVFAAGLIGGCSPESQPHRVGTIITYPSSGITRIIAGTNITVNTTTDGGTQQTPIVSSTGGGGGSSGSGSPDPWMTCMMSFVASQVPTLTNPVFRSRLGASFSQEVERETASSGGTATIDLTRSGGVMILGSGTTGGGVQIVRNLLAGGSAGQKAIFVPNIRTSRWAIPARVMVDSPAAGSSANILNMTDEATVDTNTGINGAVSTTHWVQKIGTATAVDTGVALPTAAFGSFVEIADATNVTAWSVNTSTCVGTQIGTPQAQSTTGAVQGHPDMYSSNTAGVNLNVYVDDWAVITEAATN